MKYLFFFNGQLLLLCYVCCKIAIQDFVTRLHKKIRKIYDFTDGLKPVGISKRVEKNYGIVPLSPTDYNLLVFHRELQNIYGIVPQSPTAFWRKIPTELRTSQSAHMSDTCPSAQIPMDRKVWRDFWTFLVRISINFWRYYRRKLMPPTTINFRRKNCSIKPPLPQFGSFFLWLCFFFIFSSPFIWLHLAFLRDLPLFGGSFKRYVFFFLYLCIFLF